MKEDIYLVFKRLCDIVISSIAIIILIIPMLIISIIIMLNDHGPAFYKAYRLGIKGQPFNMIKFRSMCVGADNFADFFSEDELAKYKKEFKLEHDKRLTKIGSFLRKTSMDELPQFFNVFIGQMSLVGPRPIVKEELKYYGDDAEKFISIKPGLTGYWQAYARNMVGYSNGERQRMELYYIDNRSFWFDVKIIFKTFSRVISGKGSI